MATKTKLLPTPSQTLPHHHLSHVLSISFDHYGRRFATASNDRTVRVWDLNAEGVWMGSSLDNSSGGTNNEWQAHKGAVWDVCWGHPEFGQVLATAGAGESCCYFIFDVYFVVCVHQLLMRSCII